MESPMIGFEVGHRNVVVVYDKSDGNIVHVHEFVTERGARKPGRARLEREARAHAADTLKARRLGTRQVGLLHADAQKFEPSAEYTYKVDVARRRLRRIKVRLPRRRRKAG